MESDVRLVPVTTAAQLAGVERMAREIWHEYYVPIIGQAQVDYMVEKFQTADAMKAQIEQGYEYFDIRQGEDAIGYVAIRHDGADANVFISKFYVLAAHRKSGVGRKALALIQDVARERGAKKLWLTVNKGNPSIRAYQRLGFGIVEALVMDIGGGYVMDDYRMEKGL